MIISLYAGGMTLRDIQHHLASTIGTEISHETILKIVDQIGEEILIWQQRPLEALYPVIFLDAIVVKVRDGGHVRNKAAHLAIGIDMEGIKHVLGIWVQANEGATFWAAVCAELAAFEATELGRRYPSTSKAFRDAWERFTPFLAFPLELRRVIYTTNSIESLNYQLRKITQEPRPLPQRSRGRQAALAGDLRHRRQTSARPGERTKSPHRATQSTRTPRRGPGHDELETSTATALTGLPRPHQPPPLTTMTANAYTKNLTGSPGCIESTSQVRFNA